MRGISITKLQIPITLGFTILKYKVKGTIFQIYILNLYHNSKIEDKSLYKKFYSSYV